MHYAPEFLSKAVTVVDEYFAELSQLVQRPLSGVQIKDEPLPDAVSRATWATPRRPNAG